MYRPSRACAGARFSMTTTKTCRARGAGAGSDVGAGVATGTAAGATVSAGSRAVGADASGDVPHATRAQASARPGATFLTDPASHQRAGGGSRQLAAA